MSFTLHPRLEAGTHSLGMAHGCHVLLKNNAVFPWFLIVPEVEEGIEDLHQLSPEHYAEVTVLIHQLSSFVADHFQPTKLNVGCIGNMVRQMHIHIVGRSEDDPAWPGTVWASDTKEAYDPDTVVNIREAVRESLDLA